MNQTNSHDTIGGFDCLYLTFPSAITCISVVNSFATVALKTNRQWWKLPATSELISAECSPQSDSPMPLFDITVKARIPQFALNDAIYNQLLALNGCLIVATVVGNNDVCRLYGSKQYPLTATCTPLTPSEANGYCGLEVSLSGSSALGALLTTSQNSLD